VLSLIGSLTWCFLTRKPAVDEIVAWPVDELPKAMRDGSEPPFVCVAFQFLLTPTADPLVWLYHPGYPPKVAPASYEVRFVREPKFPARPPVNVCGRPSYRPDAVRRASGVPGVVVLSAAETR